MPHGVDEDQPTTLEHLRVFFSSAADRAFSAAARPERQRPPSSTADSSVVTTINEVALTDTGATPEVDVSERDRRALAAANPNRKIGKRKKFTARKEIHDIIANMDPASCGPRA
jgi:hypothetical protein